MPKIEREVTVKSPQGLHARPAAMFVQIASKYNSVLTVCKDGQKINGKSIMGILTLAAQAGQIVLLEAEGEDAEALVNELENLLNDETI